MDTKKLLEFGLDMKDPYKRILRRALIVGVLTAVSVGLASYTEIAPEYLVPIISAALAAVDKALRENKVDKQE